MESNHDNLKTLLSLVEEQFGRKPKTPSDFNELLLSVFATTGRNISLSTVKRMWGYVSYHSLPSQNTLNVLSQYIGFHDWESYCNSQSKTNDSDFITDNPDFNNIQSGATVTLKWGTNKGCTLRYIGSKRFVVIEAHNIKLREGDELTAELFSTGQPIYMKNIIRGEQKIPLYIAAKKNGLKYIRFEA